MIRYFKPSDSRQWSAEKPICWFRAIPIRPSCGSKRGARKQSIRLHWHCTGGVIHHPMPPCAGGIVQSVVCDGMRRRPFGVTRCCVHGHGACERARAHLLQSIHLLIQPRDHLLVGLDDLSALEDLVLGIGEFGGESGVFAVGYLFVCF